MKSDDLEFVDLKPLNWSVPSSTSGDGDKFASYADAFGISNFYCILGGPENWDVRLPDRTSYKWVEGVTTLTAAMALCAKNRLERLKSEFQQ